MFCPLTTLKITKYSAKWWYFFRETNKLHFPMRQSGWSQLYSEYLCIMPSIVSFRVLNLLKNVCTCWFCNCMQIYTNGNFVLIIFRQIGIYIIYTPSSNSCHIYHFWHVACMIIYKRSSIMRSTLELIFQLFLFFVKMLKQDWIPSCCQLYFYFFT